MKKLMPIVLAAMILAGCTDSADPPEIQTEETSAAVTAAETVPETTTSAAETSAERTETTTAETAIAETTTAKAEEKPPINAELGVNGDGTLSEVFTERVLKISTPDEPVWAEIYPSLWDFDEDGIPEIIVTYHNGGQGRMPSYVYSAETLEQIGEFNGFCRDGFTRFLNQSDGSTVIYNFYEHSNWQRFESVETVKIEDGKLISQSETRQEWTQTRGECNPRLVYSTMNPDYDEHRSSYTSSVYCDCRRNVCTSYTNFYVSVNDAAANAVESYNNYIKAQALAKDKTDRVMLAGEKNQYVFLQNKEGFYFIDENGEKTMLREGWEYYDLYRLWDDIIVTSNPGNCDTCDVYILTDGKPEFISEISGKGVVVDYGMLYNGTFEITDSVYDLLYVNGQSAGGHSFNRYQFYRNNTGFHEYGSIVVPLEEFNKIYGEDIKPLADELAKESKEIYEVLYRADCCFILNCREQIYSDEEKNVPAKGFYYMSNITLKPLADGGFTEVYRDHGVYKTALIPEIADYPEKMYVPKEAEN